MLVEYIGRFEELQQSFDEICGRLQVSAQLGHAKPSGRSSYRDYYDDASRELVAEHFAADLESFNYRF
jgi:hypothetical protein